MSRSKKWRVRQGSEHETSDLVNALHGLTMGLRALDGFDSGKQANALRALGLASATHEAFSGMFGVKTGSGKYTEGMRFPCAANPDGSPKTTAKLGGKVIGYNVETKLPIWDYVPENSQVDSANSEREKRKHKARVHLKDARRQETNARNRARTLQAWKDIYEGRISTSTVDSRQLDRDLNKTQEGRVLRGRLAGLTEGLRALCPAKPQPLDLTADVPIVHAVKARRRTFIVDVQATETEQKQAARALEGLRALHK